LIRITLIAILTSGFKSDGVCRMVVYTQVNRNQGMVDISYKAEIQPKPWWYPTLTHCRASRQKSW